MQETQPANDERTQMHAEMQIMYDNILRQLNKNVYVPDTIKNCSPTFSCDNYIALGHGAVTSMTNDIVLKNKTFIYKDRCGELANITDALNMIGFCTKVPDCSAKDIVLKFNELRKFYVGSIAGDIFVENIFVKETTCSMLFNFHADYEFCLLSGLHLIDETIINKLKDSISVLGKIRDHGVRHTVITLLQIRKIFKGSIIPTENDVVEMMNNAFPGKNLYSFETFKQIFRNTFQDHTLTSVVKAIDAIPGRNQQKHANIIFANCRPIENDGSLVSSVAYPKYGITQNTKIVSEAQKNSDDAVPTYTRHRYIKTLRKLSQLRTKQNRHNQSKQNTLNQSKQNRHNQSKQNRHTHTSMGGKTRSSKRRKRRR